MNLDEFRIIYKGNSTVKNKTKAFNELDVDLRKWFLNALPEAEREKFINKIRQQAVNDFWTHEQELIRIIQ